MTERLFEEESPAGGEEVTASPGGASSFGIVGWGATGGVLVESLCRVGFDNVLLIGNSEIEPIEVPSERKLVLPGETPDDMRKGEKQAVDSQLQVYEKMRAFFSQAERIFVCVGADGASSAGSTLVLVETAAKVLFDHGMTSGQRIGVFVAYPTAGELAYSRSVNDARFLVDKLFEFCQKKVIDPLLIADRSNICALFDSLAMPAFEPASEEELEAIRQRMDEQNEEELKAIAEAEAAEDEAHEKRKKAVEEQNSVDRQARGFARDNVYGE